MDLHRQFEEAFANGQSFIEQVRVVSDLLDMLEDYHKDRPAYRQMVRWVQECETNHVAHPDTFPTQADENTKVQWKIMWGSVLDNT